MPAGQPFLSQSETRGLTLPGPGRGSGPVLLSQEMTLAFVSKVISLLFNMLSSFSSKEQVSFNFMAAVTIYSDFGAPQK